MLCVTVLFLSSLYSLIRILKFLLFQDNDGKVATVNSADLMVRTSSTHTLTHIHTHTYILTHTHTPYDFFYDPLAISKI